MGGEENISEAMVYAKDVAHELMMQVMMSSKDSVNDDKSPLSLSLFIAVCFFMEWYLRDDEFEVLKVT